jgi:hypothetical protein
MSGLYSLHDRKPASQIPQTVKSADINQIVVTTSFIGFLTFMASTLK